MITAIATAPVAPPTNTSPNSRPSTSTIPKTHRAFKKEEISKLWAARAAEPKKKTSVNTRILSKPVPQAIKNGVAHGRPKKTKQTDKKKEENKDRLAARMVELHRASAVAAEVEAMRFHYMRSNMISPSTPDGTGDIPCGGTAISATRQNDLSSPHTISILPAQYDFSLATANLTKTRHRAFHLLDLGSIVGSHRTFFTYTAGPGLYNRSRSLSGMVKLANHPKNSNFVFISPQFDVQKNRDKELLKLLGRLKVGLRCSSKSDIEAAREALAEVNGDGCPVEADSLLLDDVKRTRKPDGYLRALFAGGVSDSAVREVGVDGPSEVRRIASSVRRFVKVKDISDLCDIGYILRLPKLTAFSSNDDPQQIEVLTEKAVSEWEDLVRSTFSAAMEAQGELTGVSVSLCSQDLFPTTLCSMKRTSHLLHTVCTALRRIRIILVSLGQPQIRIDMTDLPYPLTKEYATLLTKTLSSTIRTLLSPEDFHLSKISLPSQLSHIHSSNVTFTADVSHLLVAHAGGLCTRIIGVKRVEECAHYYIDDGCYGSLSSNTASGGCVVNSQPHSFLPIPLYGTNDEIPSSKAISTPLQKATVWGPTCDGLDRVCKSVLLPDDLQPNRDWLVFPNLGCGGFGGGLGLGTAFNGFDAPDTAYCVLGYFTGGKDGFGRKLISKESV